jgi:cell division protein FtsL
MAIGDWFLTTAKRVLGMNRLKLLLLVVVVVAAAAAVVVGELL